MINTLMGTFTEVAAALRAVYGTGISIYPESTESPSVFPCVTIIEIDNAETARDLSNNENAANIGVQIDIYSNKSTGNLVERLGISDLVDVTMRGLKYHRVLLDTSAPNIDTTIKRLIARYSKLAV